MRQNELSPAPGSRKKRKRIGRGYGSGHGATAGRGNKGQKSRSGGSVPARYEGGQLSLMKRLPQKRGFTNIFRVEYAIVPVQRLDVFDEKSEVTPERMIEVGLVKSLKKPIKILGDGDINKALVVKANKFSESAKKKIEAAGGRVEVI